MATKNSTRTRAASGSGDSPTVHRTLASYASQESASDTFVLGLPGGHRVAFPDPGEMEWQQAESFLMDLDGKGPTEVFKKWLSPQDATAMRESKMNWRTLQNIMRDVRSHYSDIFGTEGEGDASLT